MTKVWNYMYLISFQLNNYHCFEILLSKPGLKFGLLTINREYFLANFSVSLKELRRNFFLSASLIITLPNNTKGLALLHQVNI